MDRTQLPPEFLAALTGGGGAPQPPMPGPPGVQPQLAQSPLAPYSPDLSLNVPPRAQMWADDPFLAQLMQQAPPYPVQAELPDDQKPGYREKPDLGSLKAAVENDKERYGVAVQRMSRDVAIYRQDVSGVPTDFNRDRDRSLPSGAISTLVNKMSNMFAGAKETYIAPFMNTPQEKSAQAIENYLYRSRKIRKVMYARNGGADLQHDEFFFLLLQGRYVTRVLPNLKNDVFPFAIDLLDPATCFPVFGSEQEGMVRMSRRYMSTVGEILSTYGSVDRTIRQRLRDKLKITNEGEATFLNQPGQVIEYWDSWWRYVSFMDEDIIPITDHKYGFVPFVDVPAVGEPKNMATPGGLYIDDSKDAQYSQYLVPATKDLAEKGVSVFHHLIHTHKAREALMTLLLMEVEKAANPPTVTYVAPHLMNENIPPLRTGRGGNNKRMLNLMQVEGLPTSPRPTDFAPLMQHIDQEFTDGSLSAAAMGNIPGSNISGLAMDSLLGTVKDMALPYINAWAHGQSLIAEYMLYHLRDRILPVTSSIQTPIQSPGGYKGQSAQLTAEQIKDVGCYVEVEMDDVGPDTKLQRVSTANQAVSAGLMSQRTGIEFIGTKDPDAEFAQIVAEKAMQHPMLMENYIIPSGFIARGEPELADMWNMLVVGPKLQQIMSGGAAQGGGAAPPGAAGPPGGGAPAGPMQQQNQLQGLPTPPPGGPLPGQGRGPAPENQ